jgi:hypothetical protein
MKWILFYARPTSLIKSTSTITSLLTLLSFISGEFLVELSAIVTPLSHQMLPMATQDNNFTQVEKSNYKLGSNLESKSNVHVVFLDPNPNINPS